MDSEAYHKPWEERTSFEINLRFPSSLFSLEFVEIQRIRVLVSAGSYNKIPKSGWLKQETFISHSSGDWKPRIKVPANLVLSESLLGLQLLAASSHAGERKL